jgi:antitoxin component YwqK of YwqJK toxin-antitoxin module
LYANDEPSGPVQIFLDDGKILEGYYNENGVQNGEWIIKETKVVEDGRVEAYKIYRGTYVDGLE